VFEGGEFDTLTVVSDVKDEEAIMNIRMDLDDGTTVTPVPSGELASQALSDPGFPRSRWYRTTYNHVAALGDYLVRTTAADYAGNEAARGFRIRTGSAVFYKDQAVLAENGSVVFGQTLRAELRRPFAFSETDMAVFVDAVPASEYDGYSVVRKDSEGKHWEVAFTPDLAAGSHVFKVSVGGFEARRTFIFSDVRFAILVGGRNLFDNDFVASDAVAEISVASASELGVGDISVELDGVGVGVAFERLSETEWLGELDLGSSGVGPGEHTLVVRVGELEESRRFRISEDLGLVDVSVFPNPFSRQTYFYYTLLREAREVRLMIFTVRGRKIVEEEMSGYAGYNQHVWDGRDAGGDEVANGTYIYRVVVEWAEGRREFTGRLVKLD
jgi:hypothetical protein